MSDARASTAPSRRLMRWGVAAAGLFALGAGVLFYLAAQDRAAQDGSGTGAEHVTVAVTARDCEPNELSVPAGERSFEIMNQSGRVVEWEILDGVMVIAERENIAPGFSQTVSARLAPGDYEMTCGLLSNPRGTLHVTPSAAATQAAAAPTARAFVGPLSEYRFYLIRQGAETVERAKALAAAIRAGDLGQARALYEPAHQAYKRVEPVAHQFSDLANRINPVADYLAGREEDPAFAGYHRIEYALFAENSLEGTGPVADRLVADLQTLQTRLRDLKLTPEILTHSPGSFAAQLAEGRIATGENRYARTDLDDLRPVSTASAGSSSCWSRSSGRRRPSLPPS